MTADPAELPETLLRSSGKLADGATEMSHSDIATAITQVLALLESQGIGVADCVAFACDNDVPSAVVLLAFLASGRTFILLPRAALATELSTGPAIQEAFCRYHLQVGRRQDTPGAPIHALADTSVAISENPCWRADLPETPARLFVPTSGSTGRAKLVRHRHHLLWAAAKHCADRLSLVPSDRIALTVPIAHMFGLGAAFLPAVLAGASVDLQANSNTLRFLARERHFDPTVAFMTPSFGDALTRVRKTPRMYRVTIMAGDRLPADLFDRYERLHGCLINLYGSTELGVIAAGDPADPPALRRDATGRPMPGVTIQHPDRAGNPDQPDAAETLSFQHDYGFDCYVGPDGQALHEPDGSLASGRSFRGSDIGRVTDGYLAVHGRADDLVNRDGFLVACDEVATALRALPGIAAAVVLGGNMTRRGRALIAFCVLAPEHRWNTGLLRKACLSVLPARAIPDEFVFRAELPRLASGKVDRVALMKARASF